MTSLIRAPVPYSSSSRAASLSPTGVLRSMPSSSRCTWSIDSAFGSRLPSLGGEMSTAGLPDASDSATAKVCRARTATTIRATLATANGRWSS